MSTKAKVKTRNWSLDKFAEAVARQARKAGIPAKSIKTTTIKKAYDDGLAVRAAAAALTTKTKKAA